MVMSIADQIVQAGPCNRNCDAIEVIDSHTAAIDIQLQELPIDLHTTIGLAGNAKQVGIVVPEHDVNRAGILSQFVHNERRAQVAAADQGFSMFGKKANRRLQVVQVIVNVRYDTETHL